MAGPLFKSRRRPCEVYGYNEYLEIHIYELSGEDRDIAKQQPPYSPVMGYDVMLRAHEWLRLQCNGRLEEPVQVVLPDVIWVKNVRSTVGSLPRDVDLVTRSSYFSAL